MSKYMIRVYVRYHLHRFSSYWKLEGRTFLKDVASARLASRLSAVFALFMLVAFTINGEVYYWQVSLVFIIYAIIAHVYRDYRTGRHVGWYRKRCKEVANE